ncbi:MAG: L,D-transpeptidase [Elainella sp. Prado103]|nr:L,D-transpeptidase [Elainella sp. Prado103]
MTHSLRFIHPWIQSTTVLLLAGLTPMPVSLASPGLSTAPSQRPETATATPHFVPQAVLDVVNQLTVGFSPTLPGLGNPEQFLPSPDPLAQISLVIKLGERRVYVYQRHQLKTSFPVAIGREGWETPVGKHQVIQMLHDPTWQHPFTGELIPPGQDNPLGVRWIGFWTDGTNYIGFHGTPNEASVGSPASHGCVRMYNQDVIKLFEMVRIGTPVEVLP